MCFLTYALITALEGFFFPHLSILFSLSHCTPFPFGLHLIAEPCLGNFSWYLVIARLRSWAEIHSLCLTSLPPAALSLSRAAQRF